MDPSELTRHRAREAHLGGSTKGVPPGRPDVVASWRRVSASGVDPSGGPEIAPLDETEIQRRRRTSGLEQYAELLQSSLQPVVDIGYLVIVGDADGRLLWRLGRSGHVRRLADDLGFVPGSAWTEGNVGTNAIGTALVLGSPVSILGAEHYVESHVPWGCVAAPLRDPRTDRIIGVVDISGPRSTMHPSLTSTVAMASRLATMELLERHRRSLEVLRCESAHVLARISGPAVVVDRNGHVAAVSGFRAQEQLSLPHELQPGQVQVPGLGDVVAEPLPGGWLLRPSGEHPLATRAVLDLTSEPMIEVLTESGPWSRRLTPRHAELLLALVRAGADGLTGAELAEEVFADAGRVITVRSELVRLRRTLGSLVLTRPYRLSPSLAVETRWPVDPNALLPGASAPVVIRTRAWLAGSAGRNSGRA